MIDLAQPLNPYSRLNRGLTMWAICPTAMGRPGQWPELVYRRNGSLVNHVQSGSRGWNPTQQEVSPGFNEYRFDTTTMYGLMPAPPRNEGSMSAAVTFFFTGAAVFANAMCGRRTQSATGESAWYIQHRTTGGLSVAVLGTNGSDFVVVNLGPLNTAGFFTLGFSYDHGSRVVYGYRNGLTATGSGTIAGSVFRDPHKEIFLGCAEFNGSPIDFNIFSVSSDRIWDRILSRDEWAELYSDQLRGYQTTLRRPTRYTNQAPLVSVAMPPRNVIISQAVKAASIY